MTSLTRETHTSVAYYAFREPFFALTFNPPGPATGSSGVSRSLASDSASGEEPAVAINSGVCLDEGPWVGIRA